MSSFVTAKDRAKCYEDTISQLEKTFQYLGERMNKAKRIKKLKENVVGYALILPLLISLTVFTIYPLAMALFDSFFYDYIPRRLFFDRDWSLFGFDNYIKAFKTGDFQHSMKLTFIYAIVMLPSTLTISFFIAWQLN